MPFISRSVLSLVFAAAICAALETQAQQTNRLPGGYDPIQAGRDAYAYHHQRRLWEVNRQLWLLDQLRWQSAWPYGYPCPPPSGVADLGPVDPDGVVPPGAVAGWPHVSSHLFGYRDFGSVPQPLGQIQMQTGPNRWESHPVYPGTPLPGAHPPTPRTTDGPPPTGKSGGTLHGSMPSASPHRAAPPPAPLRDPGPEPPPAEPADRGPVEF